MAVFVLIRVFGDIYMTFLNGIGKIKLQMWLYVFGALINIPLSIYFINYLNLGSAGVILATCISLLGLAVAMPIQSYKSLNEK
jgi:O-antigen/teichoic acid export membrane protein